MATKPKYEYGVQFYRGEFGDVHRKGYTKEQAEKWVREWNEMATPGTMRVVRREIGEWEYYNGD